MTDDQPTEHLPVQQYLDYADHSRVCAHCLALKHTFRVPALEDIQLPVTGARFGMWLWRCECADCRCPAVLVTSGPPIEPDQRVPPSTQEE